MNVSQIASRFRSAGKHRKYLVPELTPITLTLGQRVAAAVAPELMCSHIAPDASNVSFAAVVVFTDDHRYHLASDAPLDAIANVVAQEVAPFLLPGPMLGEVPPDDWPSLPGV